MKIFFFLLFNVFLYSYGFSNYFRNFSIDEGLPSSEVYQVIQDNENYIWFATDRGVSRYDGYQFETFGMADGLTDDVVFGFHLDYDNRLWFITYTRGVCYYKNGRIHEPDFNKALIDQLRVDGYPPLSNLFVDKEGNYWIGTFRNNVYKVDSQGELTVFDIQSTTESNFGIQLFDIDPSRPDGFVYSSRISKTSDSVTIYHIAPNYNSVSSHTMRNINLNYVNQGRIARYDDSTFYVGNARTLNRLTPQGVVQSVNFDADILNAISRDKEGNLWVGTRTGIYMFREGDLNSEPFHYLSDRQISSFYKDNEEGYWFTSLDQGVFYLPSLEVVSLASLQMDATRIKFLNLGKTGIYAASDNGNAIYFKDGNLNNPEIIARGYPASLNFGYFDGNICFYREDGLPFYHDEEKLIPMKKMEFAYRKNDHNSNYYYLTQSDRLYLKNVKSNTGFSFIASRKKIRAVAVMPESKDVWFGTFDGLYLYRNKGLNYLGDNAALLSSRISDLDVIDSTHILVSTRGNGVWILNTQNLEVIRLNEIDNSHSNSSTVDKNGSIWVSTYSGVYKIKNPLGERELVHYTIYDGLISNEVLDLVPYNDEIWIATSKGISVFDKDWEPNHFQSSAINVLRLSINGEDFELKPSYKLSYDENDISIIVNVLSFRLPARFEYKMSGLQEDWISTSDREVNFSNLKPGNYKLMLRRTGFSGMDTSEEPMVKEISFKITEPLWNTRWFILSIFSAIVIALVLVIYIRYRTVRKENRLFNMFIKSERKALRSQINPHFIFNSLSAMLELSKKGDSEKLNYYILKFSKLMRKTLEGSRHDEILLTEEIKFLEMYLQLEKQRTDEGFEYEINVTDGLQKRNYLIPSLFLQPYLENAIKHGVGSRKGEGAWVKLNFYVENNYLVAEVEDNGIGYFNNKKDKKGHQSLSMKINKERLMLIDEENKLDVKIETIYKNQETQYVGTRIKLTLALKEAFVHEPKP